MGERFLQSGFIVRAVLQYKTGKVKVFNQVLRFIIAVCLSSIKIKTAPLNAEAPDFARKANTPSGVCDTVSNQASESQYVQEIHTFSPAFHGK